MKLLIIFMISFNCLAQIKVEITKENEATMSLEKPTLNQAVKNLKKIILAKKRFEGVWSEDLAGNIFKRDRTRMVATGNVIEQEIFNMETEALETVKGPEYVQESYMEYYKPLNFEVTITDVTELRAQVLADKNERGNDITAIKAAIQKIKDSDKQLWEKRLLIRLVKELRE